MGQVDPTIDAVEPRTSPGPAEEVSLGRIARDSFDAFRHNALPASALFLIALVVCLGYYFVPPVAAALDAVGAVKDRIGLLFVVLSTAVFGGLIPTLVEQLRPRGDRAAALRDLPFFLGFWAIKGVEIELLYRGQALLFETIAPEAASRPSPWVLIGKTLIDQFLYVPLWAVPTMVAAYAWKDAGYSVRRLRRRWSGRWYRRRVVPVMIPNWGVWLPTVVVIYTMPVVLQLPLQNLVLCLWCLLLVFMTRRANDEADGLPDAPESDGSADGRPGR